MSRYSSPTEQNNNASQARKFQTWGSQLLKIHARHTYKIWKFTRNKVLSQDFPSIPPWLNHFTELWIQASVWIFYCPVFKCLAEMQTSYRTSRFWEWWTESDDVATAKGCENRTHSRGSYPILVVLFNKQKVCINVFHNDFLFEPIVTPTLLQLEIRKALVIQPIFIQVVKISPFQFSFNSENSHLGIWGIRTAEEMQTSLSLRSTAHRGFENCGPKVII